MSSTAKRKADDMAAATTATIGKAVVNNNDGEDIIMPTVKNHTEIIQACTSGDLSTVRSLLDNTAVDNDDDNDDTKKQPSNNNILSPKHLLAASQSPSTGQSPLMMAAQYGHLDICTVLIEAGAPWNAVDRYGKCAGDYATNNEKWSVVNYLVEVGTKAELILGASIRLAKQLEGGDGDGDGESTATNDNTSNNKAEDTAKNIGQPKQDTSIPISHEPCTKPDYLHHTNVRYNAANTLLLDNDDDAVMMEWERPLMNAHANILTNNGMKHKRVLNIGFGLGIIDTALQGYDPSLHVIIEAHPTVYKKMTENGWDKKTNVRICYGKWQDELPKLVEEGIEFDGIFYDTYGEHFTDLEDFHDLMVKVLCKPDGIYSFFNGLAPDNLFFHGVACNCVKIQLSHLGLDTEFAQCEIQVDEKDWEGVRRKYWHGRNTYYLPIVTWKKMGDE